MDGAARSEDRRVRHLAVLVLCLGAGFPGVVNAQENPSSTAGSLSLAAVHSDLKFSVTAPARSTSVDTGAFGEQVRRIARGLSEASAALYPEAVVRLGAFDAYVADSREIAAQSSATGRIAVNAGFAALKPTDDWLALVLAREMSHVLAGHHDNNSTASLVTSVLMNIILPGSGLVKSALSFAGSQVAAGSGRDRQIGEADAIALRLLEKAGYSAQAVALNVTLGPRETQLGDSAWARDFAASGRALVAATRGSPAAPPAADAAAPVMVAGSDAERKPAPVVASTVGHLGVLRLYPEDVALRARPSGMPGPLLLGGHAVPPRRLE